MLSEKATVTHSSNAGFLAGLLPWFLESHLVTVVSEKASFTHSSDAGFLAGLLPWFLESRASGKPSGHSDQWFPRRPQSPIAVMPDSWMGFCPSFWKAYELYQYNARVIHNGSS